MTRGGRHKDRNTGPDRKCIATGEVKPVVQLVRFVVGPEGQIVPDIRAKLPGRGIWVTADRASLELAAKKGLFSRGAKQSVKVPDDLLGEVERQLVLSLTSLLGLARKAGQAIAGYEKVKSRLLDDESAILIQASDGSERGKSKLRPSSGEHSYIGCLTASELGLAFGRDHVIHGALSAGRLATRVVEEASRLAGVRDIKGGRHTAGKDEKSA